MTCETTWCLRPPRNGKGGLCAACQAARCRGDDLSTPRRRKIADGTPLGERLSSYGWSVTDSGCWNWNGQTDGNGYGQITVEYKHLKAYRAMYLDRVGPIPEGQVVRHKCDNGLCVNPDHLELGTHADNMYDMAERLRSGRAKLTVDDVLAIRARHQQGETLADLGRAYRVTAANIGMIVQRKTWRHV